MIRLIRMVSKCFLSLSLLGTLELSTFMFVAIESMHKAKYYNWCLTKCCSNSLYSFLLLNWRLLAYFSPSNYPSLRESADWPLHSSSSSSSSIASSVDTARPPTTVPYARLSTKGKCAIQERRRRHKKGEEKRDSNKYCTAEKTTKLINCSGDIIVHIKCGGGG